jgi:hypothetical protein
MATTLEPAGRHFDLLTAPTPGLPADAFAERVLAATLGTTPRQGSRSGGIALRPCSRAPRRYAADF